METGGTMTCPKCGTAVAVGEKFCSSCGAGVGEGVVPGERRPQDPPPDPYQLTSVANQAKIGSARKWLLAISILTLVSGLIFYALNQSEVEKQIREAEVATASMSRDELDAAMQRELGMTWEEAIAHDRGEVKLLLAVNITLAVLYFGMFLWARKNALGATVTAFLLFVSTIVVSAVIEPTTMYQGLIIKIIFIAVLVKGIQAALEERKALA